MYLIKYVVLSNSNLKVKTEYNHFSIFLKYLKIRNYGKIYFKIIYHHKNAQFCHNLIDFVSLKISEILCCRKRKEHAVYNCNRALLHFLSNVEIHIIRNIVVGIECYR